jgi:pimeloyl-ACP methyl ester carboxylesterase
MGILGPKRTQLVDIEHNTRGPFRTVENEFSILDQVDLVMIDPVGTGFSRAIGKGDNKDFWGVDQDVTSVSNFIVQYLSQYGRWASPKFVLGESYGGMRTGGVSFALLMKHNVALNGVILVSPYLDVVAGAAGCASTSRTSTSCRRSHRPRGITTRWRIRPSWRSCASRTFAGRLRAGAVQGPPRQRSRTPEGAGRPGRAPAYRPTTGQGQPAHG